MKTTPALVAALVVVALAYPSIAGQRTDQGQHGPSFEDLLREYRSGDSAAAVRTLAGWSVPRLRALLDQITWLDRNAVAGGHNDYSPPFSSKVLASVVMLHTEAVLSGAPADAHLGLIRRALRQLESHPDARSFVVSWRVVMASHFMSVGRSLDSASLAGAAGDDAETLLLRGAIAEAAASDTSRPVPVNVTLAFGSRPGDWWVQLAEAERDYRAALERDQTLLEARVRLGRVLAREGKADAARETLTEARKQAGAEGFLAYLAALFLGGVNEQAKQIAAAVECYTAAIKMYPEAQTAHIALGHLLDGDGRVDDARTAVGQMFAKPGNPARDPWWVYGYAQFWQTDHRVAQLRAFARR